MGLDNCRRWATFARSSEGPMTLETSESATTYVCALLKDLRCWRRPTRRRRQLLGSPRFRRLPVLGAPHRGPRHRSCRLSAPSAEWKRTRIWPPSFRLTRSWSLPPTWGRSSPAMKRGRSWRCWPLRRRRTSGNESTYCPIKFLRSNAMS